VKLVVLDSKKDGFQRNLLVGSGYVVVLGQSTLMHLILVATSNKRNGFLVLFYSLVGDKAKKVLSTNPSQPATEFQATLYRNGSWLLLSIVMTLLPLPHEKSDPNIKPLK
jgi:hypothetical protein